MLVRAQNASMQMGQNASTEKQAGCLRHWGPQSSFDKQPVIGIKATCTKLPPYSTYTQSF